MYERRNSVIHRSGFAMDPQASCPIATGEVGFWTDANNNTYFRNAAGADTIAGSAGGNTYHEACRLASNAALGACTYDATALTLTQNSAAAEQIDSVTVAVGDRILVKNQSTSTQNGIYVVTVKGTGSVKQKLTRAPDCNASNMFEPGFLTPISEGTVNADSVWEFSADAPFVMDTNNATFAQAPLSVTYGAAGDMSSTGVAATNSAGVANKVSRSDHQHAIAADVVMLKEVDHNLKTDDTTTAATAGGAAKLIGGKSKTSGTGGAAALIGGAGDTTGAGGTAAVTGGAGGGTSGAGGAVSLTGGAGTAGNSAGGAANHAGGAGFGTQAGGAAAVVGGAGGATGGGGGASLTGGAGGATSGTGGAVAIAGGAGTNGNANGGAITIDGGAKNGSGADGAITIGGTTGKVNLGKSGGFIGFFGATAVVQPTASTDVTGFAAGSGTTAKSDSVWAGASGASAYTVGGVITALKALGLLAA